MKWSTAAPKLAQLPWAKPMFWRASGDSMYEYCTGMPASKMPEEPDTQFWEQMLIRWVEEKVITIDLHPFTELDLRLPVRDSDMTFSSWRSMNLTVSHVLHVAYTLEGDDEIRYTDEYAGSTGMRGGLSCIDLLRKVQPGTTRIKKVLGFGDEIWVFTRGAYGIYFDFYVVPDDWDPQSAGIGLPGPTRRHLIRVPRRREQAE